METKSAAIHRKMLMPVSQLPITGSAHKTTVVGDRGVCTVLAACDMPTESRGAAVLDGAHHLQLAEAHVASVGIAPGGSVVAEDVRDLESRTGHECRPLRRRLNSAERQRRQPVEWTDDRTDRVGGDAGVKRSGIEFAVPQQS
jgi:hypothetical protein